MNGVLVVACFAVLVVPSAARAGAADVAALQVALRQQGVHRGAIDGIFGPETRAAVRRFQRSKGLVVDGVPGRQTRRALGPFARHRLGSRAIKRGMGGWDVAGLQFLLSRCELPIGGIDGVFGALTDAAVRSYQRRAGLKVDGVVGRTTIAGVRHHRACHAPRGAVPRGVRVAGLAVGGLSARRAESELRSAVARPLVLRARGRTLLVDPGSLARPWIRRAVRRALHADVGQAIRLRVDVWRARVSAYATTVDRRVCAPPVDAKVLGLHALRPRISRARLGCRVVPGFLERVLARRLRGLDRSLIRVPTERLRPAVTRANFGPIVVVRRASHRLHLYRGFRHLRAMPVATGRTGNPTPLGRFTIRTKIRRPWWYPPSADWAAGLDPIPPGPGNPLGTRWMGFSAPGVGIHGTPDAASVGYSRSHGCVPMFPHQAEWLFRRVHVGTPVFIAAA